MRINRLLAGARQLLLKGRNAGWASAEFLVYPLLLLAATPLYLSSLGTETYGLWMLANAVAGLGGAANLGMGITATRYVAQFAAGGQFAAARRSARQCLTLSLTGACLVALAVSAGAGWAAAAWFESVGSPQEVAAALRLAAPMLVLQQADHIFSAVLKGREMYGMAARLEMGSRLASVAGALAAAFLTGSLEVVLYTVLVVLSCALIAKAAFASIAMQGAVWRPTLDREGLGEILRFGSWNWLQGISSTLAYNLDRLIIGAFLDARAVAHFSVCAQLAQFVHSLPAAAFSVLVPLTSRRLSGGESSSLADLKQTAMAANLGVVAVLATTLLVLGEWALELWVGKEFAAASAPILRILVAGYALMAITVTPHYMLLGAGMASYTSITNAVGAAASLASAFLLTPALGLTGAALARFAYVPALAVNFIPFRRL